MDIFPIGSIVKRRLDGFFGCFTWHWGVYVGDGQVVHFNGLTKKERSAIIRVDCVGEFAAERRVFLHRRPDDLRHGIATAHKAREIQSSTENGYNGVYRFFVHNCQDFCRHCVEV